MNPLAAVPACETGGVEKLPSGSHRDENTKFIFNFHSSIYAIIFLKFAKQVSFITVLTLTLYLQLYCS